MNPTIEKGIRLVVGPFSGRIFAVTKWRADPDRGSDAWEAVEKVDVTDNFNALAAQVGYVRPLTDDELDQLDQQMDQIDLHLSNTTDAQAWAEEFCKRFEVARIGGDVSIVEEPVALMIGWFANAIEVGRAAGQR